MTTVTNFYKPNTEFISEQIKTEDISNDSTTKDISAKSSTESMSDKSNTEGISDESTTKDISIKSNTEGMSDKSNTEGISDESTTQGISVKPNTGGISDKSTTEGISDKSTTEGISDESTTNAISDKSSAEENTNKPNDTEANTKEKCYCKCWTDFCENQRVQKTKNVLKYIIKPILVIILYYADIITDIILAVSYLRDQHYFWFSLTAFFIIVPWIAGFVIYYKSIINGGEGGINVEKRWGQVLCSAIAPVYAQMKIYITYKTAEEEDDDPGFDNYNMEEESKLDETLVQIIESFTESAPQLLLQMYITILAVQDPTLENEGLERNISMGFAWIKIAYSLTARETARINWLRSKAVQTELTKKYRENKAEMLVLKIEGKKQYSEYPYPAIFMHMTMRTVEIAQRIIALGFIAATPQFFRPVMIALAIHWLVAFGWELAVSIKNQKKTNMDKTATMEEGDGHEKVRLIVKTESRKVGDVGFASEDDDEDEQSFLIAIILMVVKASILLFCHENQTKHRNTLKMVLFYTIFFVENTVAVSLWLQYTTLTDMWLYEPVFYLFITAPNVHVVLHIIIDIFFMKQEDSMSEAEEGKESNDNLSSLIPINEESREAADIPTEGN